jgi:hypothetical protein
MDQHTQTLTIEAPEDIVVSELPMLQGRVKKGAVLATLTSPRLKWLRGQLEATEEDLDIQDRFFGEVEGKSRRKSVESVLAEHVKSSAESLAAVQKIFRDAEHLASIGAMDPGDLPGIQKLVTPVEVQLSSAEKDQLTSLGRFKDLQSRIAIARIKLKADNEIYVEATKRLKIVSPADGWFVASVGLGGFVLTGDAIGVIHRGVTKEQKLTLICAAPDDAKVHFLKDPLGEIEIADEQPIATLSSSRIEKFKAQLHSATANLDVRKRFFTEHRNDELEKLLKKDLDSATKASAEARSAEQKAMTLLDFNLITITERLLRVGDRASATAQLASANLEIEQFPNKIKDLRDRLDNATKRLATEKDILGELVGQMSLVPPPIPPGSKARFVASVGEGGFVQKGDPIGVIHL